MKTPEQHAVYMWGYRKINNLKENMNERAKNIT